MKLYKAWIQSGEGDEHWIERHIVAPDCNRARQLAMNASKREQLSTIIGLAEIDDAPVLEQPDQRRQKPRRPLEPLFRGADDEYDPNPLPNPDQLAKIRALTALIDAESEQKE